MRRTTRCLTSLQSPLNEKPYQTSHDTQIRIFFFVVGYPKMRHKGRLLLSFSAANGTSNKRDD